MKKIKSIVILSVLISACDAENKPTLTPKYFDLKRLIERQIKALKSENPSVKKNISMSEKSENQQVKSIDWSKELEFFIQADLNKPAYTTSYQMDSSAMGVKYTLKLTEKLPIKFLNITRVGEEGVGIEALISNENYLYQSEKHLKLTLKNNQISNYRIDGFQKIIFGDKKLFLIEGKIIRKL